MMQHVARLTTDEPMRSVFSKGLTNLGQIYTGTARSYQKAMAAATVAGSFTFFVFAPQFQVNSIENAAEWTTEKQIHFVYVGFWIGF